MNPLIVAAIVVGVLALIGTIIVVALKIEKKRSEALQAAAGAEPKRQPSALPLGLINWGTAGSRGGLVPLL